MSSDWSSFSSRPCAK